MRRDRGASVPRPCASQGPVQMVAGAMLGMAEDAPAMPSRAAATRRGGPQEARKGEGMCRTPLATPRFAL